MVRTTVSFHRTEVLRRTVTCPPLRFQSLTQPEACLTIALKSQALSFQFPVLAFPAGQ